MKVSVSALQEAFDVLPDALDHPVNEFQINAEYLNDDGVPHQTRFIRLVFHKNIHETGWDLLWPTIKSYP